VKLRHAVAAQMNERNQLKPRHMQLPTTGRVEMLTS